ncbi:hypothetical protein CBER1_11361 [Cercospora berteroae]|uniref:FAD/NAD(P)-binding domain-containing protein n=1 Tax=Cercospora berteroae TaxID=357750 RepID=A0A2S6C013_9PEZI|nr:hypothetical protein CBER1_11361 [Cercospora berteroae]
MAREKRHASSANRQRSRVADESLRSHMSGQKDSPLSPTRYDRAPTPPQHRTSHALDTAQYLNIPRSERNVMRMYPTAEAMAGNYLARKPVPASANQERSRGITTDVPSSPPVAEPRIAVSQYPSVAASDSRMDLQYQYTGFAPDHEPNAPFQSVDRRSHYSSHPADPFLLLPTAVHQPICFAFELQAVVPHGALRSQRAGNERQTHTRRPGSARQITHAEFAILEATLSHACSSIRRPAPQQFEEDWQSQESSARAFRYDRQKTSHHHGAEEFVDAREVIEDLRKSRDVSYYLDAVEEQVEDEEQMDQTESDLPMSDSLPQLPTNAMEAHTSPTAEYGNPETIGTATFTHVADTTVKPMVEVQSPRMQRKFIDFYRGSKFNCNFTSSLSQHHGFFYLDTRLEQPIFTRRKLRVVAVGAGFANITLAHKHKYVGDNSYIDLVVVEKSREIGGTWFENTYPGVACDVPAHIYCFPFAPNPDWSSFYVEGPEFLKYITKTVDDYKLREYIQVNTKLIAAKWSDEKGKWLLKLEQNGTTITDEADVLINGAGFLNRWEWPKIPNREAFRDEMVHSAHWEAVD